MQIKRRGGRAVLIESTYVRKGLEGNSHGFTRQRQVCSLSVDALSIPPEVDAGLDDSQRKALMERVVLPAQERAAQARAQAAARAIDAGLRLSEALGLVHEAARLSLENAVAPSRVIDLSNALRGVVVIGGSRTMSREAVDDPIETASKAIRLAVKAVDAGHYGRAPAVGVRETKAYKRWQEIQHVLLGEEIGSLMRALQRAGFVKTKS